ncbi:MAG: ATP-binding protein [Promethearchaeota archaeon]|nr:MAG: ATP-binding protein [Candidatus Lokiarchaeota archaeon]
MAKKEEEHRDVDIELETIEGKAQEEKLGEVCAADTGPPNSVITMKILSRPDTLRLGQPIVIESDTLLYYSLIMRLYYPPNPTAERFANSPFTELIPPSDVEGVRGKEFYGLADMSCLKILPKRNFDDINYQEFMREFDTIPPIFSIGRDVTEEEFNLIYQESEFTEAFGTLRGFHLEVPLDFAKLVKKPFGLFGRTGIGKSILNKILALFILKHNVSQMVLFDMQGEYGLYSRADNTKGLAYFYQDKIQMYLLSTLKKGDTVIDGSEQFFVYKQNISASDIIASAQNLNEPTINVLYRIEDLVNNGTAGYDNLIDAIRNIDADIDGAINAHSLRALRNRIVRFDRYDFITDKGSRTDEDSIQNMFTRLKEGKSLVVDFGQYGANTHLYLFIANMITRRLYSIYNQKEDDPDLPPLTIILEEAHKFLQPNLIRYTVFDRIAREMRKFQLTLGFVDQRPSQIDEEVYSQIANTFVMHMNDERDINTVVKTLPNSKKWKGVITGLQKRQVFVRGDAIAVPTIIDVLDYTDEENLKKKLEINVPLSDTLQKLEKEDMSRLFLEEED